MGSGILYTQNNQKFSLIYSVILAVSAARVTSEFSYMSYIWEQMNINIKFKIWKKVKGNLVLWQENVISLTQNLYHYYPKPVPPLYFGNRRFVSWVSCVHKLCPRMDHTQSLTHPWYTWCRWYNMGLLSWWNLDEWILNWCCNGLRSWRLWDEMNVVCMSEEHESLGSRGQIMVDRIMTPNNVHAPILRPRNVLLIWQKRVCRCD